MLLNPCVRRACAAAGPTARESVGPRVAIPPFFEDRLLYYNGFERGDGSAEINKAGAAQLARGRTGAGGIRGRCMVGKERQALRLRSEAFSPHRPLTVAFWWALKVDGQPESNFGLFHLTNGRGFVSHFSRGKGRWCALKRPAAVLQVYHLPGIANVNGIYDRNLAAHLALKAGMWHHTAVVFNGASRVDVYTDGRRVWKVRLKGRRFSAADKLHDLTLGSPHGVPMALDEVIILRRAATAEEVATYVGALREMAAVRYPSR